MATTRLELGIISVLLIVVLVHCQQEGKSTAGLEFRLRL